MTIGRFGKICRSNAAKNGWADAQTPVQGNAPPFSNRRARDCAAGAFEMSANNLPVADDGAFCGKRREVRSGKEIRQVCDGCKSSLQGIGPPASGFEHLEIFVRIDVAVGLMIHAFKLQAVSGEKKRGL
jgi:hypothetical protein